MVRNTALNVAGKGIPLILALIALPATVRLLGDARVGLLSIAWAVLGYFAVFDLGLGRAATKFASEAIASGNPGCVGALVRSVLLLQGGLGALAALCLWGVSDLVVTRLLDIPADLRYEAVASIRAIGVCIPLIFMTGTLRGALEAAQRFDIANGLQIPLSATNFVVPLVGGYVGWSLTTILLWIAALRALGLWVHVWVCRRSVPGFMERSALPPSHWRRLWSFGGWVTVSSLVAPLILLTDRFVISNQVSIEAVTAYSILYEMTARLLILPASLAAVLFPTISGLVGSQLKPEFDSLFARPIRVMLLALGPFVIALAALSNEFLTLWMGAGFAAANSITLQLMLGGVLFNGLAQVPFAAIQGRNRPDITAWIHICELPLYLILMWFCVGQYGAPGAALAFLIRSAADALVLTVVAARIAGMPLMQLLLGGRLLPAVGGWSLVFGTTTFVMRYITPEPLKVGAGVAIGALAAVGIWMFILTRDERARLLRLMRTT